VEVKNIVFIIKGKIFVENAKEILFAFTINKNQDVLFVLHI
jgi:hypothetical protein